VYRLGASYRQQQEYLNQVKIANAIAWATNPTDRNSLNPETAEESVEGVCSIIQSYPEETRANTEGIVSEPQPKPQLSTPTWTLPPPEMDAKRGLPASS